jgi:hypothetical protein
MGGRVAGTRNGDCLVSHILAAADPLLSNRGEEEPEPEVSMNFVWIVVGVVIFGVLAKWTGWRRERGRQSNLGFVSEQWLVEHRFSQISDRQQ